MIKNKSKTIVTSFKVQNETNISKVVVVKYASMHTVFLKRKSVYLRDPGFPGTNGHVNTKPQSESNKNTINKFKKET